MCFCIRIPLRASLSLHIESRSLSRHLQCGYLERLTRVIINISIEPDCISHVLLNCVCMSKIGIASRVLVGGRNGIQSQNLAETQPLILLQPALIYLVIQKPVCGSIRSPVAIRMFVSFFTKSSQVKLRYQKLSRARGPRKQECNSG
mgnify:FL=1